MMNHTNMMQMLAPRLCQSSWDSTFDLFPLFTRHHHPPIVNQRNWVTIVDQSWSGIGWNPSIPWLRSTWWWKSDAVKGCCKGHLYFFFSAADCHVITSSCAVIKQHAVLWKRIPSWPVLFFVKYSSRVCGHLPWTAKRLRVYIPLLSCENKCLCDFISA